MMDLMPPMLQEYVSTLLVQPGDLTRDLSIHTQHSKIDTIIWILFVCATKTLIVKFYTPQGRT